MQSGPLRLVIPLQAHRPIHKGKPTGPLYPAQCRSQSRLRMVASLYHPTEWNILTILTGTVGIYVSTRTPWAHGGVAQCVNHTGFSCSGM